LQCVENRGYFSRPNVLESAFPRPLWCVMSAPPVPSAAAPRGGLVALALLLVYVVWGSTYLGIAKALHGARCR